MTKIAKPPHTKVSLTWSKLNVQTVIADAVADSVCGKNLNTFEKLAYAFIHKRVHPLKLSKTSSTWLAPKGGK